MAHIGTTAAIGFKIDERDCKNTQVSVWFESTQTPEFCFGIKVEFDGDKMHYEEEIITIWASSRLIVQLFFLIIFLIQEKCFFFCVCVTV